MATTTTTLAQHNMGEAELTKLEQFVAAKFCWDSLDEAQREKCVAYEDGPRLQFKTMMGMKYGWDVAGEVQLFWNDVLCPRLQHHYRSNRAYILKDSYWDGNTKCLMIGTSTKRSKPAVLIMSEDKGIAKRFARIIKRDDRFQASCFDLLASNSSLEFRAGNEGSFSGTQIMARSSLHNPKYATLGGTILVGGKPFGLTVAHLFFTTPAKNYSRISEVQKHFKSDDRFEVYDPLEDPIDEEDELDQPSKNNELTERDRNIFLQNRTHGKIDVYQSSRGLPPSYENCIGYTSLDRYLNYIGYNDLDWALIVLKKDSEKYLNVHYTADGTQKLSIRNVLTDPPTTQVLICSSKRAKETRLSRTKTLVSLPWSSAGLETAYAIDGVCGNGECGSWVIDSKTGDAFGVLVAVSVFEKLSYVLPLCDVLDRIRRARGTSVELLTESTLEEKAQHSQLREHQNQTITPRLEESSELGLTGSKFSSRAPATDARLELGPTEHPPPVPPGWIAQWDSKAQNFYYVQISTGISTWYNPKEATDIAKNATDVSKSAVPPNPALEPRAFPLSMLPTPAPTTYGTSTRDIPKKTTTGMSGGGQYGGLPVPYYPSGGMNMPGGGGYDLPRPMYISGTHRMHQAELYYRTTDSVSADSSNKPTSPSPVSGKGKDTQSQPDRNFGYMQ